MTPGHFCITSPSMIVSGAGCFCEAANEAARLMSCALIVTGRHLQDSAQIARLRSCLAGQRVEHIVAEPITGEPTVADVDKLAEFACEHETDGIIAIGGGSVLDCAKAAAIVATNSGNAEDYQTRKRKITVNPLAQIMVPTTTGTGSEATRVSVLTNPALGIKRSISHVWMTPDVVVLDPELPVSLPLYLPTATAMDAFAHAIESAVSTDVNPYTRGIALAGIEQLAKGLPRCQKNPSDIGARQMCLLGSCFAGLAMQAGLGASHSLAPAICIASNARHSEAVAALLPNSIRLNEQYKPGVYNEVKRAMNCSDVAERFLELCAAGGFSCDLSQFGLCASDWDRVLEIMNRYASHRKTNPAEVTDDYAKKLFLASIAQ